MNNLNDFITNNFNDNIDYIQSNHSELFLKLSALDNAIANQNYEEKYELVYENDNFDVLEKNTNNYLYNKDSSYYSNLSAKSIDYELNDNLFASFHKHNITAQELLKYEKEDTFNHHMSGYASIMHYIEINSSNEKNLKNIDKFIFFGTGLGEHIKEIDIKINAKVYLIVEDDLELFRLSLFTINYKNLSQNKILFFSIFEDEDEFSSTSSKFLDTLPYYNHYIKYFQMLNFDNDKRNLFHIIIANQPHLLFFYNALLTQYMKPINYILDNYKFIKNSIDLSHNKIINKPFLLLAAGPSLQKNTQWLKENHNKFITIAITSILPYLEKENIVPDIITHLDAFDNANMHFDNPKSLDFLKKTICIFSARLPIEIINRFTKEQLFLFENGTQYLKNSLKPSAPCVGSITYQILLFLKVRNIYLLGLDQTIDSKTGKTHSDSQEYLNVLQTEENAFSNSTMKFKESVFYIEGNFEEKLLTTPHFKSAIDIINISTKKLKQQDQNIYNLSNGAKFIDIEPLNVSKINLNDINMKENALLDIFNVNSFYSLDDNVVEGLQNRLDYTLTLKNIILNQQKINFKEELDFKNKLKDFFHILSNKNDIEANEISRVIDTYLKYIYSYIFNFLNTQETTNENYNVINKLLTNHLLKIINYYYDKIKEKI